LTTLKVKDYDLKTVLETPHVIVGAAIASKVGNPLLALPLALASHLLLEQVPHWNPHLNTEKKKFGKITKQSTAVVIFDSSLALISGGFIALYNSPSIARSIVILAACFLSVLPDLVEAPYFFLKMDNPHILRWIKFQKKLQRDAEPFWGIVSQLAIVTLALLWIY